MCDAREQGSQKAPGEGDGKERQVNIEFPGGKWTTNCEDKRPRHEAAQPACRISPVDDAETHAGATRRERLESNSMAVRSVANRAQGLFQFLDAGLRMLKIPE